MTAYYCTSMTAYYCTSMTAYYCTSMTAYYCTCLAVDDGDKLFLDTNFYSATTTKRSGETPEDFALEIAQHLMAKMSRRLQHEYHVPHNNITPFDSHRPT